MDLAWIRYKYCLYTAKQQKNHLSFNYLSFLSHFSFHLFFIDKLLPLSFTNQTNCKCILSSPNGFLYSFCFFSLFLIHKWHIKAQSALIESWLWCTTTNSLAALTKKKTNKLISSYKAMKDLIRTRGILVIYSTLISHTLYYQIKFT